MKKILSIVAVMACLFMTVPAHAQLIKFGVKGGVNVSKLTFSKDVYKGDNRTGFFIGPTAELTIPLAGLGFDVSALYNQTEAKFNGMGSSILEVEEKMKSIEFPINVKWTIGLGSTLSVFVAGGPQFGFNVGDSHYAEVFDMNSCYKSFNVGGGLKLFRHLQAGVNYNFGISRLAKSVSNSDKDENILGDIKRKTWQLSLTYMF